VVAALAAALALLADPVGATTGDDVTGDITDPVIQSMTLEPAEVDVTDGERSLVVTIRATDDNSGVREVWLAYTRPDPDAGGFGINIVRISGNEIDGVYRGTIPIAKGSPPGAYEFYGDVSDRVGNVDAFHSDDLRTRGFPGGFTVVDRSPDTTKPTVSGVRLTTASVDVRTGPQTIGVQFDAADASGIQGGVLFVVPPDNSNGGAELPAFSRASGTDASGTWSGQLTIPRYAPQGRWDLFLIVSDKLHNRLELRRDDLVAAGFPSGFDVVSEEDVDAPAVESLSITPFEVDVHDADRTITIRAHVVDRPAGVQRLYPDRPEFAVQFSAFDPVSGQGAGTALRLVSGTPNDGWFEGTVVVPRSSATGVRPIQFQVDDEVGNWRQLSPDELVLAGGVPALVVYNIPQPPVPVAIDSGDGSVTLHWDPPADDGGAPITEYVIEEVGTGIRTAVAGDARSATISGLSNDVSHAFVLVAVNKAGPSAPSSSLAATPRAAPPPPPPPNAPPAAPQPAPSRAAPAPPRSGYWMVTDAGAVTAFGDAAWSGDAPSGAPVVDIEVTPSRAGYWLVDARGAVTARGDAPHLGDRPQLRSGERVTTIAATPTGAGYWLFTDQGRVVAYGDAPMLGDLAGVRLNGPVLDSVATPTGRGYYLVASDGGVFTFGDATFVGSMGSTPLNAPVQSLVPDADGEGYWLVASDGGIFAFDAAFLGSMGSVRLNRPVAAMVASTTGAGYLMVAEDGGVFTFGDVVFRGSLGDRPPPRPVVAVTAY
jgi:hypothetical protein